MTFRRSIRHRRGRKAIHKDFELQLTSMMDILVIILVFLLKSYSTSTNSFTSVPESSFQSQRRRKCLPTACI